MSFQKETQTFFWFAVVFLAMVFAVAISLGCILFFGIKGVADFLKDYSGLLGAIFAVVIAAYTIKRQTENVQMQIESNIKLDETRVLRLNIDEGIAISAQLVSAPIEIVSIQKDHPDLSIAINLLLKKVTESTRVLHSTCSKIGGELAILSSSYQATLIGMMVIKISSLGLANQDNLDLPLDTILKVKCTEETEAVVEFCKTKNDADEILDILYQHVTKLHEMIYSILISGERCI